MTDDHEDLKDECMNDPFWAAAEIGRLRKWKDEASAVIEKWEHVAEPIVDGIDQYLGWFKWDAVAVEVNAKDAEIERLRDVLNVRNAALWTKPPLAEEQRRIKAKDATIESLRAELAAALKDIPVEFEPERGWDHE